MANAMPPSEIKALARIIDDLDYYQVLHVPRGATSGAVKRAYHETARAFHPDAHRHTAPEVSASVERIARRVMEAYTVLRDPRRRRVYDDQLASTDGAARRIRISAAEAEVERRADEETHGRTPNGRRYFAIARSDLDRGDTSAAIRNLQTALAFEPGNAQFRSRLEEVRRRSR